jgi:CheY-like chemotaxis protein
MKNSKPILLIEDDRVDAMTVQRALKDLKATNLLHIAKNGEEALKFLKDQEKEKPGIILLDVNMPKMNGIEFLKVIKQNDVLKKISVIMLTTSQHLKKIPVVMLTMSQEGKDMRQSFELGIAGYMKKPIDYKQIVEVIRTNNLYWRTLSELP